MIHKSLTCSFCGSSVEWQEKTCPQCGRHIVDSAKSSGGISIGTIQKSRNFAIVQDSTIIISNSSSEVDLAAVFEEISQRLDDLPVDQVTATEAKQEAKEFLEEAAKGEKAQESFLNRRLHNLARMSQDILDVVTACVIDWRVGTYTVAQKIARKVREEFDLSQ